jgi:hypothetical protein
LYRAARGIRIASGEVPERLKGAVLKTATHPSVSVRWRPVQFAPPADERPEVRLRPLESVRVAGAVAGIPPS